MKGLIVSLAFLFAMQSHASNAIVPIADFLKSAEYEELKISPNGDYIAATLWVENRTVLAIVRLSDMKTTAVFKAEKDAFVDEFDWVSPKRVLLNTAKKLGLYEKPFLVDGLWGIDCDGSNIKRLTDIRSYLNGLPNDDDNVLIRYYHPALQYTFGLLNIYTGKITPSKQAAPSKKTDSEGFGYFSNYQGDVLVHIAEKKDSFARVIYTRASVNDAWLISYDEAKEDIAFSFIGFSTGSREAYFSIENNQSGPNAVVALDMKTQQFKQILKDDNVDPFGSLKSPLDGSVFAFIFYDGKPRYEYLDANNEFVLDHKRLLKAFAGSDVRPVNATKDGQQTIYHVRSDKNSGDFYLYDRKTKNAKLLVSNNPSIDPEQMASVLPVKFKARDGMELEGFITMNGPMRKNMPFIINPHGGPFEVFDQWGFDSEMQMLANNGYGVFQVNYRGSGNYGKSFVNAGHFNWGRKMQDDLTDATHWLVENGYTSNGKICIYGASYGAYAALMGAVREPDLYKCVIGNVGVYDLEKLRLEQAIDGKWSKKIFVESIGITDLDKISPVNFANQIKAPVLLAGGELDYIAHISHTKKMYSRLKSAGKTVELKIYPKETHGNYLYENRLDWANRLLKFLHQHIGDDSGSK